MVGIKNVEMPKCCMECRFRRFNMIDGVWCGASQLSISDSEIKHPDCPLIEIKEGE